MSDKLKVILDVDGVQHALVLPDIIQISEATLNRNLSEQPGLYTHYALLATRVALKRDSCSQMLKDACAQTELAVRSEAAQTGEKMTEDKVKARVQVHPDVLKAKERLFVAEKQAAEAAVIKEAFFQRLQALIALSANVRAERSQVSSA